MLSKRKRGTFWKTAQHNQKYLYSAFQVFIALCTHCFAISLKRNLWDWPLFPYCRWGNWGRENNDFLKLLTEWMAKVRYGTVLCIRISLIHGFQIPSHAHDSQRFGIWIGFAAIHSFGIRYSGRIWGEALCQGSLAAMPHQRLPCQVCYFNFPLSSATSTIII